VISRPYRLLVLVPMLAILGAPWMANRIEPRVFGLPFLLAWIVAGVLLTSLVMWIIHTLDRRHALPRA
jgi:hypothetical protein